jgi:protocatechuate 3,4-dioxygenase alpha subunit
MGEEQVNLSQRDDAIALSGIVIDGNHEPVPDALIEIVNDSVEGTQFGRAFSGEDGSYRFLTAVPLGDCILVSVFARGLLQRLVTRCYIRTPTTDDSWERVALDRRRTLLATETPEGYRFDIVLQGPHETVFFVF